MRAYYMNVSKEGKIWCEHCLGEVGMSGNSVYCWPVDKQQFTCDRCKKEYREAA